MRKLAYIFALTIFSNCIYAADAPALPEPTETSPAQVDEAKNVAARTGVRKPTGDVNKFWDNIDWNDLSPDEQKLWSVLSDGSSWDKLSKEERAAATELGFNKKSWNSVPAAK